MRSKNKPSLLNAVSFRSQTAEHVATKILKTESTSFGVSYSPVPELAARILSGEISEPALKRKFDPEDGDTFQTHRQNVAMALLKTGRKLKKKHTTIASF